MAGSKLQLRKLYRDEGFGSHPGPLYGRQGKEFVATAQEFSWKC
jgi:hypothetical protein